MTPKIKICGITRPEDAILASNLGVDAIGLVFYGKSPRAVTIEQASEIASVVAPFTSLVGLFVDEDQYEIQAVLDEVSLDVLQFHGDQPQTLCADFGRRYFKAIRIGADTNIDAEMANYPDASAFLLDSHSDKAPGGTGETFDWEKVPATAKKPIILAGGLDPDNVASAIRQISPYAVDVSSGVESSRGIKDADKMTAFVRAVRGA
ncbi:MAG: phosphoribosylanthranilate isomerase [Gammaproteobacteria bacterium]|nr:phosphoribosylanthranilate isomerase [Gammaproteobacteria bacterium]MDH5593210.1 phosphoribosylanthranilate isomerase [Gammaproteobacteria bacterium]